MENISIDKLDDALKDVLEEYSDDVSNDIKEITHQVSKKFKKDTQRDAPRGRREKYYKHISVKTTSETIDGVVDTWYVKDPEYRLTHLIKNGHQTRNGGRTKSNNFIDKNYEIADKEFEDKVKEVISSGH